MNSRKPRNNSSANPNESIGNKTLSIKWQKWVSISTIFSSVAVIVAIWQVILSNQHYSDQIKSFKYSDSINRVQYKLLNQGYLSAEVAFGLYNLQLIGKTMTNKLTYQSLTCEIHLNNVGNIPIISQIVGFNIYFNNHKQYGVSYKTENTSPTIIYPKQDRLLD